MKLPFSHQTILVTGGTGFTGSHMIERLLKEKATIIVTNRHIDQASYFSTKHFESSVITVPCDLRNFNSVLKLFSAYPINYVLHFAGQGSIPTDPNGYIELMESNVMGTTHLLEAAKRKGTLQGFIMVSSDKAYGKKQTVYRESDPVGGTHPYEVSKAAGDLLALSYYFTFGVPVVVVRAGNIFGPGDLHLNRIVPSIIHTALTGLPLELRSDGTFIRDYIFVKDVTTAYIAILKHFSSFIGQAVHVSSTDSYSVLDLIKIAEHTFKVHIPFSIKNHAINEIPYQHLLNEKILTTGWKPTTSIEQGLQYTFNWYSRNKKLLWRI